MDAEKIVPLIFIITGVGILIKVASIFYFYKVTIKKWKGVEGVIVSYGSEYYQSSSDVSNSGWKAKMSYKYTINSITYQNDSITKNLQMIRNYPEDVELKDYKAGDDIFVYYDPSDPEKSVIDNKFSYYNCAAIIMSIIAFSIAYSSFK